MKSEKNRFNALSVSSNVLVVEHVHHSYVRTYVDGNALMKQSVIKH